MKFHVIRFSCRDPLYELWKSDASDRLSNRIASGIWHMLCAANPDAEETEIPEVDKYSKYMHAYLRDREGVSPIPWCSNCQLGAQSYSGIFMIYDEIINCFADDCEIVTEGVVTRKFQRYYIAKYHADSILDKKITYSLKYREKYSRYYILDACRTREVRYSCNLIETVEFDTPQEARKYFKKKYPLQNQEEIYKEWKFFYEDRYRRKMLAQQAREEDIIKLAYDASLLDSCWVVLDMKTTKTSCRYENLFSKQIIAIVKTEEEAKELCKKLHSISKKRYKAFEVNLKGRKEK